jgi:predicted DNA-binding WGR domain protein
MPRFESRIGRFLELEIEDAALTRVEGTLDGTHVGKPHRRLFATADEARHAAARLVARRKHHGYQLVGQARHLGGGSGEPVPPASVIALEAYFAAADPAFLTELLRPASASQAAGIAGLAERWVRDERPWARDALRAYIADGCDRPWH